MAALSTIAIAAMAAASIASTGYSIYQGQQAASAQEDAQRLAMAQSVQQEQKADQAMNKANQKKPNTAAILSAAQQAAKEGIGGTMLTGPQGVGNDQLTLGKTTLLGS